jgi:hypothetical protein
MADITVEPAALRAAATRIEQSVSVLDAARDRLAGAEVTSAASPIALLLRGYGELRADQETLLRTLAADLRDDAHKLRLVADRYEDTECRNTIATP